MNKNRETPKKILACPKKTPKNCRLACPLLQKKNSGLSSYKRPCTTDIIDFHIACYLLKITIKKLADLCPSKSEPIGPFILTSNYGLIILPDAGVMVV